MLFLSDEVTVLEVPGNNVQALQCTGTLAARNSLFATTHWPGLVWALGVSGSCVCILAPFDYDFVWPWSFLHFLDFLSLFKDATRFGAKSFVLFIVFFDLQFVHR